MAFTACEGPQSALAPAGTDADRIATLFWIMLAGSGAIWLGVVASAVVAHRKKEVDPALANRFVLGCGVAAPTVILTALVIGGLGMVPSILDLGPVPTPSVRVVGEQYWWRVTVEAPDGRVAELANELRLPVGRRTAIAVEAADVIHSLWVPSLGPKVDAIPGRETRLALEPTREGRFRGQCAEYCGLSHAWMGLYVIAMAPADYEAWLEAELEDARPPETDAERRGAALFLSEGCGACHAVRGTEANGRVGPDLTHLARRTSVGAAMRPMTADGLEEWLVRTDALKPDVHMPSYETLDARERDALVAYLRSLE